jgi:hypothetical protein
METGMEKAKLPYEIVLPFVWFFFAFKTRMVSYFLAWGDSFRVTLYL